MLLRLSLDVSVDVDVLLVLCCYCSLMSLPSTRLRPRVFQRQAVVFQRLPRKLFFSSVIAAPLSFVFLCIAEAANPTPSLWNANRCHEHWAARQDRCVVARTRTVRAPCSAHSSDCGALSSSSPLLSPPSSPSPEEASAATGRDGAARRRDGDVRAPPRAGIGRPGQASIPRGGGEGAYSSGAPR